MVDPGASHEPSVGKSMKTCDQRLSFGNVEGKQEGDGRVGSPGSHSGSREYTPRSGTGREQGG